MKQNEEKIAQISAVQARHADDLLTRPNVVGVGVGFARKGGEYTEEMALVVMVSQKVPLDQLAPPDVIPRELDGVRIDVQETGPLTARSS